MTDEEVLRCGRGIGMVPHDRSTEDACIRLWNQGCMRRDDVKPYTYTTQDGVVEPETDDDGDHEDLRDVSRGPRSR